MTDSGSDWRNAETGSDVTATGTTTDAVLIAATQQGTSYAYAGTATWLGNAIGRIVYEATKYSVERYMERIGAV